MNNKKEKIGSIYYDKNIKKWRCIYYIYTDDKFTETRKTKSFTTEKEAKDFLTSIQYQKGNNLFIKNNGIPLNQLMRENAQRKLDLNLITERSYSRIIETITAIEKSPISTKNISDITSTEIQSYMNTLKNYSNSTIKKIKEQFSQAFKYSINKGYITKNPMDDVIRPKSIQKPKTIRALDIEEQQKLTNFLMNIPTSNAPFKVAYLIEMYLGLRIGEALALRNTDINLQKNILTVNKTLSTDKNRKIIMKYMPKTNAGFRDIPIPIFIRDEIINQMKLAEKNKDKQLFLDDKGNYIRPSNANQKLKKILEQIKIKGITTHSLRHTYGTRCIEAGMRAVALQRLMGHADVAITLNTYTSVFNKYKESELEKVNNYYLNNEIVSSLPPNKLNLYNLSPNDWQVIEDETTKIKSKYNLINKNIDDINSNDFEQLNEQINEYQEEIKQLKEKLNLYKNDKSISEK